MAEEARLSSDVLRRTPQLECGMPVGQMHIQIRNQPTFETVSFYCTKPKLHLDHCAFEGTELVVTRRRR